MQRKILWGYDYTDKELLKLLLYLFVGGTAALIEWSIFYILVNHVLAPLPCNVTWLSMLATFIAYCLSTLYHYFLGNILVFNSGTRFDKRVELGLVFMVGIMGLGMNLILMYAFVGVFSLQPLLSKILASFLCVAWNYLIRRYFIFKA